MEGGGRLRMDATAAKSVDVQVTDSDDRSACWEQSWWWLLATNVGDGGVEVEAAATYGGFSGCAALLRRQ